jgi:hypothetical protein
MIVVNAVNEQAEFVHKETIRATEQTSVPACSVVEEVACVGGVCTMPAAYGTTSSATASVSGLVANILSERGTKIVQEDFSPRKWLKFLQYYLQDIAHPRYSGGPKVVWNGLAYQDDELESGDETRENISFADWIDESFPEYEGAKLTMLRCRLYLNTQALWGLGVRNERAHADKAAQAIAEGYGSRK